MASSFYSHYKRFVPELEARAKRYRAQRIEAHAERLTVLVDALDVKERQQIDADIAVLERERIVAEHFDHYHDMVARHQHAFKTRL